MKKIIITIFSAVLINFVFLKSVKADNYLAQLSGDVDGLVKDLDCGQIGQKCCNAKMKTVIQTVEPPDIPIPGIKELANLIFQYANQKKYLFDQISNLTDNLSNSMIERPKCFDNGAPLENGTDCICVEKEGYNTAKLCGGIANKNELTKCVNCSNHGIWTAVGCIDNNLQTFIKESIFGWGVGLAGMVSLLCIIFAAFQLQTSAGNPEKIKKAQQLLTSCITGLILIIFSVFILRLIGVTILRIPGFS